MHSAADSASLEARLHALEHTVRRLRRATLGLVALLFALVTCGSSSYSQSSVQEQLGLLMAREIRVGDERAAVHIVGHELRLQREDGSRVTLEPRGIRFLAADGSERAFPGESTAPPAAPPASPTKVGP